MKKSILFTLTGVLFLISRGSFAASVFVKDVSGEGADPVLRKTVTELVRTSVTQVSGFSLSNSANGADLFLQPKLLKLGDAYILSIEKLKGEAIVYSAHLKAAQLNEIDIVGGRVVRAVLLETQTKMAASVEDVTQNEEINSNRRYQATRQWRFGFGPSFGQNLNTSTSGAALELGFVWGVDPLYDVQINWLGGDLGKSGAFSDINLGMRYHFNTQRHALYAIGGVGRGGATVNDEASGLSNDSATGWTLNAGMGYRLFRTSTVNIGFEARYHYLTADTSASKQRPGLVFLGLSVYY